MRTTRTGDSRWSPLAWRTDGDAGTGRDDGGDAVAADYAGDCDTRQMLVRTLLIRLRFHRCHCSVWLQVMRCKWWIQ